MGLSRNMRSPRSHDVAWFCDGSGGSIASDGDYRLNPVSQVRKRKGRIDERFSNYKLLMGMSQDVGIDIRTARKCLTSLIETIRFELSTGKPVSLWRLGSFVFRFRKGRTMRWKPQKLCNGGALPVVSVQPHSVYVKFKLSENVKRLVRQLTPDKVELSKSPLTDYGDLYAELQAKGATFAKRPARQLSNDKGQPQPPDQKPEMKP